jgi:hypothetical protein
MCPGLLNHFNPRRLQEKATSFSWVQSAQRRRKNPWARMPHSRNVSNLSLTKSGSPDPVSVSTCAKKVSTFSVFDDFKAQNFGEAFRAPSVEELAEDVAAALRAFHQHWNSGGCLDWESLWQHRVQLPSFSRQIQVT